VYCDATPQGIDSAMQSIMKHLEDNQPARILMCHTRKDSDVSELLQDMSSKGYVTARMRKKKPSAEKAEKVFIEGHTVDKEFEVLHPKLDELGISYEEFKAHPMKYISHHIHFHRKDQTKNVKDAIYRQKTKNGNGAGN
jgi:hypothetical protein